MNKKKSTRYDAKETEHEKHSSMSLYRHTSIPFGDHTFGRRQTVWIYSQRNVHFARVSVLLRTEDVDIERIRLMVTVTVTVLLFECDSMTVTVT